MEVDVVVCYGDGKWVDGIFILLFDEEVFLVCLVVFIEENGMLVFVEVFGVFLLIEFDLMFEGWMGWEVWFCLVGYCLVKLNYVLCCSFYMDVV